jgi:hypothetical protein
MQVLLSQTISPILPEVVLILVAKFKKKKVAGLVEKTLK